ncbi:unnamed protein product [Larinioides sclopetarius]|uniref:Dihydrolipoamide acetyltransferase component of pyruvate dehydrogenase complex n=1 Tax=Larinioides sclopetarius TaxID=280406 RepID=A0AAV2AMB1_9ARAC
MQQFQELQFQILLCQNTADRILVCGSLEETQNPVIFIQVVFLGNELREIKVPQLAESLSEGDIRWDKAVGDQVAEDEVICQVETDKTAVPVHAPCAGVIEEILVEDGSTVNPGMSICKLRVGATAKESAPKEAPAAAPAAKSGPPASPSEADVSAPPPTTPPPVPPKPSAPQTSKPVSSIKIPVTPTPLPPGQAESTITGTRTEQRVKINRMRQRIAQRLKEAQNTYAMLTTFNEIDMSNVIDMRNQHKDAFLKKHNIKLGFMSAFVKASSYALQDQPVVNAVIDEGEIVYRDYVDISVAVATPKGLVVPVIRNLEKMNYADIEKVEIRPMMYVALTYDHRLIDGREAVLFLRKIKAAVEDPRIMLLDI